MSAARFRRLDVVMRKTELAPQQEMADAYMNAVMELDRQKRAIVSMVEFAQKLAGTVMQPRGAWPPPPVAAPPRAPSQVPPRAPVPPLPPAERPRPDQHTLVTWEEAMSVPWLHAVDGVF